MAISTYAATLGKEMNLPGAYNFLNTYLGNYYPSQTGSELLASGGLLMVAYGIFHELKASNAENKLHRHIRRYPSLRQF